MDNYYEKKQLRFEALKGVKMNDVATYFDNAGPIKKLLKSLRTVEKMLNVALAQSTRTNIDVIEIITTKKRSDDLVD